MDVAGLGNASESLPYLTTPGLWEMFEFVPIAQRATIRLLNKWPALCIVSLVGVVLAHLLYWFVGSPGRPLSVRLRFPVASHEETFASLMFSVT